MKNFEKYNMVRITLVPEKMEANPITSMLSEVDAAKEHLTLREFAKTSRIPGALLIEDYFTMPSSDHLAATIEAGRRAYDQREHDRFMMIGFFFMAGALSVMNPGGLLANTKSSPLTEEDVRSILEQLAIHPGYQAQRVLMTTKEKGALVMRKGRVAKAPESLVAKVYNHPIGVHEKQTERDKEISDEIDRLTASEKGMKK